MNRSYIDVTATVAVEFNAESFPSIQWNHIDGPLLHMRSGEIHWLTIWERLRVRFDFDNAYTLEKKHSPEFVKRWIARANAEFRAQKTAAERAQEEIGDD